jgi:hypothetical protein
MTDTLGRTVTMPYETWKAIQQQVETLSQDRIERNAEIKRLAALLADARKTLEVIEEPMHFDDLDAIKDDRVRMQTAARAWLTRARAALDRQETT